IRSYADVPAHSPTNRCICRGASTQARRHAGRGRRRYKSVIINRPDGEGGPEQPASADVIAAARAAGLAVEYQPVVSGAMTTDDVARFKQLLKELPAPVLAYCRSGTRCTHLFAAATEA